MSTPGVSGASSFRTSPINNDPPAALKKARRGEKLTPTEHWLARDYVYANIKKYCSTIWKSDDVNETIVFFHGLAGIEAQEKGVVGPETMAAFDKLTEKPAGNSKLEQYKALKPIAGLSDKKIDPTQKEIQVTAGNLSKKLHGSDLWEMLVTTPLKTGHGIRIYSNNSPEKIKEIAEYFKFLGLIRPDKEIRNYDDLKDAVRKFNLITRPAKDLATIASLGGEIGWRTTATIGKALDLTAEGKDWRDQKNWENFNYKKYSQ